VAQTLSRAVLRVAYAIFRDRRPDHIVKRELLERIGEDRVAFVIDDRNSVCEMWRGRGLTCYQIAEGNF
jgi:hypothetical protein